MNSLIILTLLVAIAIIVNGTAVGDYKDACLQELGINPDDFSLTDTKKEHYCVFKCIGQKAGFVDANGNPAHSNMIFGREITPELEEKIKECMTIESDDACERIYKRRACLKAKLQN